ncbi:MAG TPA: hypothetical protein PK215_02825, partial [Clostridiales bacterium]|nr:hypothetical protein [Clostridiales bacterium]
MRADNAARIPAVGWPENIRHSNSSAAASEKKIHFSILSNSDAVNASLRSDRRSIILDISSPLIPDFSSAPQLIHFLALMLFLKPQESHSKVLTSLKSMRRAI